MGGCDPGELTGEGTPATARGQAKLDAPVRATFEPVADALQATCGTLDCHGQVGRNFRLYGARGLRLDPMGEPANEGTYPDEYDQTYWSFIGLEPEILSTVVHDKGRWPERLTIIRKGRGLEHHKGGAYLKAGDDRDRCLVSWLAGDVDLDACKKGKKFSSPVPPDTMGAPP